MEHLVYCDNTGKKGERELDLILDKKKTMVIRGAAGRKIPHSRVYENEKLYFIEKGTKQICAKATVSKVENYIKLSDDKIKLLLEKNQSQLQLTEKQKERWHRKCICLVTLKNIEAITPLQFSHQSNMDDWLILNKIEDVVVGTSIDYNYDNAKF